jgi:hypothetical protein
MGYARGQESDRGKPIRVAKNRVVADAVLARGSLARAP